jgi:hypothetical protein
LFGGLVLPFILLPFASVAGAQAARALFLVVAALLVTRLALALRFRQSLLSVPLLPVGILLLLVLQWRALLVQADRRKQVWRGRVQGSG